MWESCPNIGVATRSIIDSKEGNILPLLSPISENFVLSFPFLFLKIVESA